LVDFSKILTDFRQLIVTFNGVQLIDYGKLNCKNLLGYCILCLFFYTALQDEQLRIITSYFACLHVQIQRDALKYRLFSNHSELFESFLNCLISWKYPILPNNTLLLRTCKQEFYKNTRLIFAQNLRTN